jgi:transmembrane sensor
LTRSDTQRGRLDAVAPRHIRAQAALWVTDLHGPGRTPQLDAQVRRWIDADPRHAAAFELATEAWQRSGDLPALLPGGPKPGGPGAGRAGIVRPNHLTRSTRLSGLRGAARPILAALTAMIATAVVIVGVSFVWGDALVTGPGEQKTADLADGTQVTLDANSRVAIHYDDHVRQVTLTRGEAFFTVAKHQSRPFVVTAGNRKVIAMGTSFEVRRESSEDSAFAVTLIEGRVAIEPIAWPNILPPIPSAGITLLTPGQRLRFSAKAMQPVDQPALDRVTAWQRGQLIFEDTSLREAAQEFNRYGKRKLRIESVAAQSFRVGGVFKIGDLDSFARAMANTYPLRIEERGRDLILTDAAPHSPE